MQNRIKQKRFRPSKIFPPINFTPERNKHPFSHFISFFFPIFDMYNSSKLLWDEQWKPMRNYLLLYPLSNSSHCGEDLLHFSIVTTCQKFPSIAFGREIHEIIVNLFDSSSNSDCLGTLSSFRKSVLVTEIWAKGLAGRLRRIFVAKR
jgi:hypothetical protein